MNTITRILDFIATEAAEALATSEHQSRPCSKGWDDRCAASKGRRCKCACRGANHGRSNPLSAVHQVSKREQRKREEIDMFGDLDARRDSNALFYQNGSPPDRLSLEALAQPDSRIIRFMRGSASGATIWIHAPERVANGMVDNELEQRIVYHSPTGLEFGYGGSGPADTAINVLALVLPPREAVRLHQHFKDEFIANIPRAGGELAMTDVRRWVATYYRAEIGDAELMRREQDMRDGLAEIARLDAEAAAAGVEL